MLITTTKAAKKEVQNGFVTALYLFQKSLKTALFFHPFQGLVRTIIGYQYQIRATCPLVGVERDLRACVEAVIVCVRYAPTVEVKYA